MERMLNTWRTLAPDKSFGGMTLAQFEAAAAPSQTARQKILNFNAQRINAITERMAAAAERIAAPSVRATRAGPSSRPGRSREAARAADGRA